jgi:hypothetical protein
MRFAKIGAALLAFSALAAPAASAQDALNPAERLAIERACERLLIAYTVATDDNNTAGIYGAYAADGVLKNRNTSLTGAAAIEAYFKKRVPERVASGITTRHVLTNIHITAIDKNTARGTAYQTLYRYDARKQVTTLAPVQLATITTEFVRTDEGWRFKHRHAVEVSAH